MRDCIAWLAGLFGLVSLTLAAACGDDGEPPLFPEDAGLDARTAEGGTPDAGTDAGTDGARGDGDATDAGPPVDAGPPPTVEPLYPTAGAGWNAWVANDGSSPFDASDTACDPESVIARAGACIHAGEMRVAELPQLDDCSGVEATDDRGAFEWTCVDEEGGPVRVVSTGFVEGSSLADLLDWSSSPPSWREMVVTVNAGALEIRSVPSVWWSTPIEVADEGGTLSDGGIIYVVTSDVTADYLLEASSIALVTAPEATLTGTEGAESAIEVPEGDFRWIEATVDATGNDHALAFTGERSRFNVVHRLEASGGESEGLVARCDGCRLTDVVVREFGGSGVVVTGAFPRIRNLTSVDNRGHGVVFAMGENTGGGDVRGLTTSRNLMMGILLGDEPPGLVGYRLENVVSVRNRQLGLRIPSGSQHVLRNLTVVANGGLGGLPGISFGASGSIVSGVVVAGNGSDGITVSGAATDNVFTGVLAANNRGSGIRHSVTARGAAVWANVLSAQNGAHGMVPCGGGTLMNVALFNNGEDGLLMEDTRRLALLHVATSDNGSGADDHDVEITGEHALGIVFHGVLQVGSAPESCMVRDAGPTPGMDGTCGMVGDSDAVLEEGSIASAFVGPLLEGDPANSSDTDGMAAFAEVADWTTFALPLRAWGVDGDELPARRGDCFEGDTCRIYDWNLAADADSLREAVPVPADGNAVRVHTFDATTPMACDEIAGAVHTENSCRITFLRNAVEILGDGAGNDNALCESGERCLYTPNIGVYQGHGELEMVADIEDGTLDDIDLLAHETNGR